MAQAGVGATQGVEITLTLDGLPEDMEVGVAIDGDETSDTITAELSDDVFTQDTTEIVVTFSVTDQSEIEDLGLMFWLEEASGDLMEVADFKVYATLSRFRLG